MPLFFATPAMADEPTEPVVIVVTTPGGDDSSYQVPLTTTVTFDGVQYSSVYATTNSVITFGQPDGTYWTYPSTPSISLYSMDWVVYPNARADEHLIIRASDGGFQVDISARPIWLQNATEPTNINIVAAINTDGTVSISYSLTGPTYDGQTRTGVRLTDGSIITLEEYGIVQVEQPPVLEPEPVAPTPTPTPTPEPLTINPPTGLSAVINGGNVDLSWDAPVPGNTPVERYDISWSTTNFVSDGWGWNHDQTSISIPLDIIRSSAGLNKNIQFAIRADNNTQQVYSQRSSTIELYLPDPVTPPVIPQGAIVLSEGSTIEVVAPEGQRIVSIMAWYGDPNDSTRGIDVSSNLTELASGQTSVTIESSNIYGDPAGGTVKILIFLPVYEAVPAPVPEIPVIIEPTPQPTEEPVVPEPEPTVPPTEEPAPTPSPSEEPSEEPAPEIVDETPTPEPEKTPEPEPEPKLPVTEEEAVAEIEALAEIAPEDLTDAQVEQLVEAALIVFETAEQGSPEYEQALEALAVAAEADDVQISEELAAIPLIGDVAGAALEVFNNLGNVGADMAPEVREEAEKTVIASVIATGAAVNAVAAAAAASTTSTGSSGGGASGGSSGGSGSTRRKE